jgi:hypothetical protein
MSRIEYHESIDTVDHKSKLLGCDASDYFSQHPRPTIAKVDGAEIKLLKRRSKGGRWPREKMGETNNKGAFHGGNRGSAPKKDKR